MAFASPARAPVTCGGSVRRLRLWIHRWSTRLPLDANDLTQRMDDFHEVTLRLHDCVDGLVRARRLVDHVGILAALDARRRPLVVRERERPLRLGARHHPTRT